MAQTKRGKNSSSKNKRTNTKGRTGSRSKNQVQQANPEVKGEVMLILFFVVCVLMFLSCFGLCGAFGNVISNVLFGTFGLLAYLIPIAMFIGVSFYKANKQNMIAVVKVAAGIAAVFMLCGILHGLFGNKDLGSIVAVYEYCALRHNGAGVLGAAVYGMLANVFGTVGTFVILLALLIAASVIISEKSFVKSVKRGGQKVYDTAKEENIRRKERAEERRVQKRLEMDASGVSMNVKLPKDAVHKKEDMTELKEKKETVREEIFLSSEMAEIPVKISGEIVVEEPVTEPPAAGEPVAEEPVPVMMKEKSVTRRKKKTEPAEEIQIPQIQETAMPAKQYQFPPLRLLTAPKGGGNKNSAGQLRETAAKLQQILKDFGVSVTVTDVSCGPTVTRYELQPDHGV